MRLFKLVIGLILVAAIVGCASKHASKRTKRTGKIEERAVSLRVLQERLQPCAKKNRCPKLLLNFVDLTKIKGCIYDEETDDIIVFGLVDPNSPSLRTEDFVVALRNVWLKYTYTEGITRYFSEPGCSIDPDTKTIEKIDELLKEHTRILAAMSTEDDPKEVEKYQKKIDKILKKWHEVSSEPQDIRILGIPRDTRFAKVMVEADYYMKQLVNGSEKLDIRGFSSLDDMMLSKVKDDFAHNREFTYQFNSMNRFEFCPGENLYYEDQDIVLIDKCPVILLTEIEYLDRGNVTGAGKPDPLSKEFADSFSTHYNEIAALKPIYQELEGLFRFVALAKIIEYKKMPMNIDYFLEEFPVSDVKVPKTLPGRSNISLFEHVDKYYSTRLWVKHFGGVTIRMEVKPSNLKTEPALHLVKIKRPILEKRPSADVLFWNI